MARFSLRPLLHRWSTRHSLSTVASDDHDDGHTSHTTDTAPTSHASSIRSTTAPLSSPGAAVAAVPRKSLSPPQLRDRFHARAHTRPKPGSVEHALAAGTTAPSHHRPDSSTASSSPLSSSSSSLSDAAHKDSCPSDAAASTSSGRSSSEKSSPRPGLALPCSADAKTPGVCTEELKLDGDSVQVNPVLLVEGPTPTASPERETASLLAHLPPSDDVPTAPASAVQHHPDRKEQQEELSQAPAISPPVIINNNNHYSNNTSLTHHASTTVVHPQSPVGSIHVLAVHTEADQPFSSSAGLTTLTETPSEYFPSSPAISMSQVLFRKIWVKRPNASPTLIQIKEDDLVDDVRDLILRKYANSLGKTFDAPDMTLRIVARPEHSSSRNERLLGPEEAMCRTLDSYYPGGQTVDDALIIDVPQKRTPRPSPRTTHHHHSYHAMDEFRPHENGTDYFPPMPALIQPTLPQTAVSREHHHSIVSSDHPRSISVLNTGQVPPLPSPGGGRRHREHRPKYVRQHTSSPTIMSHPTNAGAVAVAAPVVPVPHLPHRQSTRPRVDSSASESHHGNGVPAPPPLPSPPAPEAAPTGKNGSTPPTPSGSAIVGSPHMHRLGRARKARRSTPDKMASKSRSPAHGGSDAYGGPILPSISTILDGSVPPINVLIVEDNIINLRILEGLMKRLRVRWQTAMNGQIAVEKWRKGGYHLVLMDIQMPIMNGLQATKEIRRLERVNGIGVFSSTPSTPAENGHVASNGEEAQDEAKDKDGSTTTAATANAHHAADDKLATAEGLFKSPIIIVALTASSLQSDRHEALAAGCNDFLTKPVDFVWLERKVKEWGCMQALIDFDGWRKWKDYAAAEEASKTEEAREKERAQEERQRVKLEKLAALRKKKEEEQREKERRAQRASLEPSAWGAAGEPAPTVKEEDEEDEEDEGREEATTTE